MIVLLCLLLTGEADAAGIVLTPLAGAVQGDPDLDHYRWDVRPQTSWGLEAALGQGPWRAGARGLTWTTEQGMGLAEVAAPAVRLAAWQALLERRLVQVAGASAWATATAGWLHVSYSPDHVSVPAGGEPLVVALDPIDTWMGGVALSLRRPLGNRFEAGLEGERFFYSLDAAHRAGDVVVTERETFANWAVRLRVSWWLWRS